MGTSNFAVPTLRTLHTKGYPISYVFSQPPRKSKRGQKINKSPVHLVAEDLRIPIRTPNKLESDKDFLESLKLDLVIVVAYGQIIPKNFLSLTNIYF